MCLCRISHTRAFTIAGPQVLYCTTVPLCQLTWKGFTKKSGECQLSNQGWRAVFVKNYYRAVPKEGLYKIFREWPPAIRFGICPPSWFSRLSPSRAKIYPPDSVVILSGFSLVSLGKRYVKFVEQWSKNNAAVFDRKPSSAMVALLLLPCRCAKITFFFLQQLPLKPAHW